MFSQEIQMSGRRCDISIHFGSPDKIWRREAIFAKYKAGLAIYNFSDLIWVFLRLAKKLFSKNIIWEEYI